VEPAFFAGELFEMTFRTPGAPLLKALAKPMIPLAYLLNLLTTKGLPFTMFLSGCPWL